MTRGGGPVATDLKTYQLDQFRNMRSNKTLEVSPEIQRRPVWSEKSKMLLVDSIARGVPIGAITLYEDRKEAEGYSVFEVIDGKQRLTALFSYFDDDFALDAQKIANADEDEIAEVGKERAESLYSSKFSELSHGDTLKLLQYEVPVFIVSGTRSQAVQAFTRMNTNSYVLKPQEIRNAVYSSSAFLAAALDVCDGFSPTATPGAHDSGFVRVGVLTEGGFDRMQDIQFASELLALALEGDQHRRDSLNGFYDKFRSPGPALAKELNEKTNSVMAALSQISEIFNDGAPLAAFHFPKAPCENDVYALVGALIERGLFSKPQMKDVAEEVRDGLSEFRRQVGLYVSAIRGAGTVIDDSPDVVVKYAQTFLGGQLNGATKRAARRAVLVEVLNGLAPPPTAEGFSPAVRDLIWARSSDKVCGRCGAVAEYKDFHAGHIVPKSKGGPPILSNGRVEHKACNLSAGAS
jgi:hypothetical protein